ncbi:MAG: HesA/MoeB/ThiF family protein [Clostridia bacterium]|nr:HesA/MoeB/ThiF family protein [Clostridia bacterium]
MSLKSDVQGFDISKNSAVIIGCGGLGTNAAVQLAGAGIGKLLLIDYDTVEERNLNRQFFYTKNDIGKEKCVILAERLKAYSPETDIKSHSGRFDSSLADGYDIIIICVDNIETRKLVNDCCVKNKTPCVNGSINGFFGTAYLFVPGITPDLEKAGCLNENGNKNLSPGSSAAIIGSLEAKLATDYFLGKTDSSGRLYIYDNNEINSLLIRSDSLDQV